MKKIVSSILVGTLVMVMLLSGCSSSQTQTTSSTSSSTKTVEGIQYGQILSVSDSEIVLALGTMANKTPADNANQNASGSTVQGPQDDKVPQGDNSQRGTPPQGNPPSRNNPPSDSTTGSGMHADGFGKSMIELTGDKLTITVSDNTTIAYMKKNHDAESTSDTTAKLSDLKEGDIIAVTLDEDKKTALEITIMSMRDRSTDSTAVDASSEE